MASDLEASALLEEYKVLRAEIAQRVQHQLIILGGNLTFLSAMVTAFSDSFDMAHLTIILAIPLVSFVISWLYFEQDVFLTQAASYLHQSLRPTILKKIATDAGKPPEDFAAVLSWEDFRNKILFSISRNRTFLRIMVLVRLAANVGRGATLLLVALNLVLSQPAGFDDTTFLQRTLFVIDFAGMILSYYQHQYVLRLYKEIAGK